MSKAFRTAFKKSTKAYVKEVYDLIEEHSREPEEEKSEEPKRSREPEEPKKEVKKKQKKEESSDSWSCAGRLWDTPIVPCPGGEKSNVKTGIRHDGALVTVCKECNNARERKKNKEKREAKKIKE